MACLRRVNKANVVCSIQTEIRAGVHQRAASGAVETAVIDRGKNKSKADSDQERDYSLTDELEI